MTDAQKPRRLPDRIREVLRTRHYSLRTEESYLLWIRRFIRFHDRRHPRELGAREIGAFLTHLAVEAHVAASTQNQALSALLFLYREVLGQEVGSLQGVERARVPDRVPVVLTRAEVERLFAPLEGIPRLMASLLYGSGLRLLECVRLRVKDLEFERLQILVRDGKGEKDRFTILPERLVEPIQRHLERVRLLHDEDLARGFGAVFLPYALERKYPSASREWGWQYVFPASRIGIDPRSGAARRHHVAETVLQRAVRRAVLEAGIDKPASCHTCATASQPTSSRTVTTFEPCRSFSVIATCRPR